jgi:radical SAM protein with 4Fe4S-binding SPASM domain
MPTSRYFIDLLYLLRFFKRFFFFSLFKRTPFPFEILIQTTNLCNASCVMCPVSSAQREDVEYMSDDLFAKIIDEVARESWLAFVYLHLQNEPLTDPMIFKKVKMIKQRDHGRITAQIITNGSLLTAKKIEELKESSVDMIVISLDAVTKETFEKIRKGLRYEVVIGHIEALLAAGWRERLWVSFVVQRQNAHELKEFLRQWKSKGVRPLVSSLVNRSGDLQGYQDLRVTGRFMDYVGNFITRKITHCCPSPLTSMNILCNGDVILCCNDYRHKLILGNVSEASLKDIWESSEYQALRTKLYKGGYSDCVVCRDCSLIHDPQK